MNGLAALDWLDIVSKVKSLATSEIAREKIQLLSPCSDAESAVQSFNDTLSAQNIISTGVRPFATSLDLYSTWSSRIQKKATLKSLELKDLRTFCFEVIALKEALSTDSTNWSQENKSLLMNAEEPLSAIDQILTPEGDIRMDASEKLYNLSREKDSLAREVFSTMDRLVRDHSMDNIVQDKYVTTRDGRWVIPVRSGMQHHMPGVIHGSSQTKQTVFMEPEKLVPLNNRLRQIEVEIEEEIERLLVELSGYLATQWDSFKTSRDTLLNCDIRFALAQLNLLVKGRAIEFSEHDFFLNSVRHPLLEMSAKKVIGNTVKLDANKSILLLSGPNAGGKTVLLKSVGLAAQMARFGMPPCVDPGSVLPFFKNIHIGIGDSQSVDEELSTFAAHLKVLQQGLLLQGSHSLILLDEICGSTDPEEGSALARAFVEAYSQQGVFAIVTSHLGTLKSGWPEQSTVLAGSMEYDSKTSKPTYQFVPGVPGDSMAIQTATRVGVSSHIIKRSLELLSPETRARLEGLNHIEQLKKDLLLLQEHYKQESKKANALQDELTLERKKLEIEKEKFLEKTLKKAEQKVEEAISEAKAAETFARFSALQNIKKDLPIIVKAKPSMAPTDGLQTMDEFAKRFPSGSKVYMISLKQDVLVQSAPTKSGEIFVLAGSMQLKVPWTDLKAPEQMKNPTLQLARKSYTTGKSPSLEDRSLDLRGLTVEEALENLEKDLDLASTHGEDRIKIIHGHGTEALKRSIRAYLSRSVYVKKWKAGTPESGGDGITWAEIEKN